MVSSPRATDGTCEGQQYCKITVASLCCKVDEVACATIKPTRNCYSFGLEAFSVPDTIPTQTRYYQPGNATTPDPMLPSLSVSWKYGHDPKLTSRLCGAKSSVTMSSPESECDAIDLPSVAPFPLNKDNDNDNSNTRYRSIVVTDTVKHDERRWRTAVTTTSFSPRTQRKRKTFLTNHHRNRHGQSTTPISLIESSRHIPRPARPSYTEEQKYFIMYHRIVKGLPWSGIEDKFATSFGLRTIDGLTSVYYRIRKS